MDITKIIIVGIVAWTIVSIYSRKSEPKSNDKDIEALKQQYDVQITQLNERVSTLETIVTDEKYQLKREFDSLSK